MGNGLQKAFSQIHATEKMKDNAYSYATQEAQRRKGLRKNTVLRPLIALCAVLVLCIGSGFGGWYYLAAPVSYVSIDVNPSIELTLNRLDRVTKAVGQNRAGRQLVKNIQLDGMDYISAVELLVESDAMQKYLTEDAGLTFTVASPKAAKLRIGLEQCQAAVRYHGMCREADMETVHHAHACGMSLGKYQVYLRLAAHIPSLTPEQCQNMPMRELRDLLSQYEDVSDLPDGCSGTHSPEDHENSRHCQNRHHGH